MGRALASHGAPVFFQPTTAHRYAAGPATMLCLLGALAASGGLLAPLPGIVVLLGLLLAALKDVDGGQSWLRRLLPRRPGWTAEIELQGGAPDQPTLILWAPVAGQAYGRLPAGRLARALIAVPAGLGTLAGVGLALSSRLAPGLGSGLALGSAAGLVVCAVVAAVLLRPSKRLGPDA
ncbi:MAG: hypothetical protein GXP62_13020, partial [Oligoflexia bacterium]|nr:hypothetical protein [Oligoflexia bacterium]